jgi:hypothetical protein
MKNRIMKTRMMMIAMLAVLLFGGVVFPTGAVQAKKAPPAGITVQDVTGDIVDIAGIVIGSFDGTFTLTKFANQGGSLVAIGTLNGTLTDAAGNLLNTVTNQQVTLPVTTISSTCDILHLELGPLDLTLLGLNVHLDKIVLDITATQGGGLLGDLLCAVADLLNNNGPLNTIVTLLNNVLKILG